jgi:hypothetical protein
MLVWATEFLVARGSHCGDVLSVAKGTLATSPHSTWKTDSFGTDPSNEIVRHEVDDQVVSIACVDSESGHWAGLQHRWVEKNEREWTTEIVGYEEGDHVLVSVRLDCNLLRPGLSLPVPKKPYVVRRILEDLGGGDDAGFEVTDTPHHLGEAEVEDAARIVRGVSGVRLPVVYVSAGKARRPFVNVDELARWLGGMAHVVVEPSRYFSFALARNARHMNAYGGAVSIHWPSNVARQTRYLPMSFSGAEAMQREIAERVRAALTLIRPVSKCTFSHIQELVSRTKIEALKAEGSTAVGQYISAFDIELSVKEEKIRDLERELSRVRAELRRYDQSLDQERGVLRLGKEREFYPGELRDALVFALGHGKSGLFAGGRRADLIEDILTANRPGETADEFEAEIKDAFSQSGDLGAEQRRTLEDLGFTIEEAGKHYKAVYQGDDRYTFTISKTSSDHRAGKNLASTILKKLLK